MNHVVKYCCLALVSLIAITSLRADTVNVDLEYRADTLTWQLYAEIADTGTGNSGQHGLAALRALLDNVDFGANGEAVTFAANTGAIDPVDFGGNNQRPAVLQTTGGTLDIIFGQDTFHNPGSVVGGVGIGSRDLIVSGTYQNALTPPTFGDDELGRTTDGNFLDVAAPGPFGLALPWDGVTLNVSNVTPGNLTGDYNNNGIVDAADYTVWRDNLGSFTTLPGDTTPGFVSQSDYTVWKSNFGAVGSAATTSIPEPACCWLIASCLGLFISTRQR